MQILIINSVGSRVVDSPLPFRWDIIGLIIKITIPYPTEDMSAPRRPDNPARELNIFLLTTKKPNPIRNPHLPKYKAHSISIMRQLKLDCMTVNKPNRMATHPMVFP